MIIEDFKAILVECSIFFSQPSAGLTNRPQVRDSDPGTPLHGSKMTSLFANFAQGLATLSFSSVIDHYVKQRGSWGYAINYMS